MKKSALYAGLTALALSLGMGLYAHAQTQTTQPAPQAAQRTDYRQVFLSKLAALLGVDQAKLTSSLQQAANATVDEALKNQDITRTQAERLRQDIQNGRLPFLGIGGRDGRGERGPGVGPRAGLEASATLEAAAKALGLTPAELLSELRSGQTLTQIAQARKVDPAAVKNATLAALKTQLSQAVSAGRLSQAQADQILSQAQQDPNFGLRIGRRGRSR